jgi:hypothetical protein
LEFHQKWDDKIHKITGGLTICNPAKGKWIDNDTLYEDTMIPCRIVCQPKQFEEILQITLDHYKDEKAILGYRISNEVFLLQR